MRKISIIHVLVFFALHAAFAQDIRYNYDAAGHLVSAIDAQGRTITYAYDELGNLLSVQRSDNIGPVAITSVSPAQGFVGTQVEIVGFGFSAVANQNAVAFNGVPATVLTATATNLTTQVPLGATTGPITVNSPLGSATSPQPFTVLGGITISPSTATVARGTTQEFTATVTGTTDQRVAWSVNSIDGGNSVVGTITTGGLYTAPAISATALAVTVKATSLAFPGLPELSATASVTVVAVCTVTWTGAGGNSLWQNPANWSTNALPGPNDDVCIGPGFAVVLSSGAQSIKTLTSDSALSITAAPSLSIASSSSMNQGLTLSGGTLGGTGTVTVSGSSTCSGGRMVDAGTTTFSGDLTISGNDNLTLSGGRTLNTAGTTTITLTGSIVTGGATINNSGLWIDQSNSSAALLDNNFFFGALSTFNNTGTYRKTASPTSSINIVFNNTSTGTGTGVVDLQSGTLNLSAGGTASSGSSFMGASGSTLGFFGSFGSGMYTFQPGSFIDAATVMFNSGTVNIGGTYSSTATSVVQSGTVNFNPGATVSAVGALTISGNAAAFNSGSLIAPTTLVLAGGTLAGTDAVTVSGTTTWGSGTMTDAGTTTLNGDLTIPGSISVTGGRILNTTATTTVLGTSSISTGGGVSINNSGLWQDQTSGSSINHNLERGILISTFRNTGTYKRTGGAATAVSVTFNNISPGVVDVEAGTLDLSGGGTETGVFVTAAAALLQYSSGTFDFSDASAAGSAGSFRVNTAVNVAGTLPVGGLLDLAGGTFNVSGAVTASGLNLTGTLAGIGTLIVSGPTTWSSGTMTDAGITTLNGNVAITGSNDVALSGGRTLNTMATTTFDIGTRSLRTGGAAIINNSGLWVDQSPGATAITNDLERGTLLSTFNNGGIYRKSGVSTTSVSIAFNNRGTVDIEGGTLGFTAGYAQTTGDTALNGGALTSTTTVALQGGKLSGAGNVTANVSNAAEVAPGSSPGILNISGNYTQTTTGSLSIEIGGLTAGSQFDQLDISGAAALSGSLNISLIGGFQPVAGDAFAILNFGSATGAFTATNGLELGGGRSFQLNRTATGLTVVTPP